MSVLDRSSLEASPVADLHTIASELGIDGYRRLRKAELVDAILQRGGGEDAGEAPTVSADADAESSVEAGSEPEARPGAEDGASDEPAPRPRRRGGRGGRARGGARRAEADREPGPRDEPERVVEGTVELLGNGSAFVRVAPPDPSDDDVYLSAAQVRRCELVSGDKVSGPVRPPRRSERFASLVRVETINGAPADEVAEGTHYGDLAASFPTERFVLTGDDVTLKAIEWLTPFGRGSRVALTGGARAGKTEALRRLAGALSAIDGLDVHLVLAGARPEEVAEWAGSPVAPAASAGLEAAATAREQAIDAVVEQGRRIAARGGDAVVLIDALDGISPQAARRALAAARNIADGGSLTVVAVATAPVGGETTVIAFDPQLAQSGRFPAIDVASSGTMRPELLVGQEGAEAIARYRVEGPAS
jgi:transcription termination factor Rho